MPDKTYDPDAIERRWYQHWETHGYFAPQGGGRRAWSMMIPPPNVTGSLHMGHAFQDTIMDALTRYHRMRGCNALWQPGMDHAGIATQMVVERLLNAEGKTRHDLGREKFIERIWQWKNESGGMIAKQLRRIGASPDWQNERFTMDEGLSRAVNRVFVELYEKGVIYRGKRLVNWDPVLQTALSDLEVLSAEESGHLWHLRYPLCDARAGEPAHLVVATTRPETMLGDSAVAVHPNDSRYKNLHGRFVELPPGMRRIPIITDEYVDPEFGTGCVKITPAHDFNDYQVWLRHRDAENLRAQPSGGLINIFTADAKVRDDLELIPASYRGLSREDARKKIVADLDAADLLERTDAHRLMIPRGDRSGAVVEPYLTDQWFVDLTRDKLPDGRRGGKALIVEPAINAVRDGKIEFVPANWSKTYFQWMQNIEDWCISRQIWWGHRIPAWYNADGKAYVGFDEADARKKNKLGDNVKLRQDDDVLDTWFSSALWPFSTLGWPARTERLQTFYPTSVLVTGFDIIFFWVARMIMFGLHCMREAPFRQVYIHGLVRDAHGQKMSKSKGNVLDPIDLIDGISLDALIKKRTQGLMQPHLAEKITQQTRNDFPQGIPAFGADALRFTFAALASHGRDINFDLGRIDGYRNFCNKLWNAARFVLLHNQKTFGAGAAKHDFKLSLADRWMISRLQRGERAVARAMDEYRFDNAAREIYELIWNDYCDWYVEFCKVLFAGEEKDSPAADAARRTLLRVMEAMLRLAHPLMPFITEDIWRRVAPLAGKRGDTIMTQPFPLCRNEKIDEDAEHEMAWLMRLILAVRKLRGELGVAPGARVPVLVVATAKQDVRRVLAHRRYITALGVAQSVELLAAPPDEEVARVREGDMQILLPLAGAIDKDAERRRLQKEIQDLQKTAEALRAKLNNRGFLQKAPAEVVAKTRARLTDCEKKTGDCEEKLARIGAQGEG